MVIFLIQQIQLPVVFVVFGYVSSATENIKINV